MKGTQNNLNFVLSLQSNEVKNATWCELEGLKRMVASLTSKRFHVAAMITDRHRQCSKWIGENMQNTKHYYDNWHVWKGMDIT